MHDDGIFGPAMAYTNPAGTGESFEFIIDTVGYYAVAVWKADHLDMNDTNSYNLSFTLLAPSGVEEQPQPTVNRLASVHPNPFNPATTISYELADNVDVQIKIVDVTGREVQSWSHYSQEQGYHEMVWEGVNQSGKPVSAGLYLLKIQAGKQFQSRKLLLLK